MNDHYPVITIYLIITIGIVSLMGFTNYSIINQYKHYPYYEWREKSYYRWISCTFLHGNYMHLFLNLFVLWQFGSLIEQIYMVKFGFWQGALVYLALYFALAVLSSIPTFYKHRENSDYASIGASGVISGLLFIFILYFPTTMLSVFFFLPMPAWVFAFLYLGFSWYASSKRQDGIDHEAHFYGAVFGLIAGLALDPQLVSKYLN